MVKSPEVYRVVQLLPRFEVQIVRVADGVGDLSSGGKQLVGDDTPGSGSCGVRDINRYLCRVFGGKGNLWFRKGQF